MKQQSRFARGQRNIKPARVASRTETHPIAMEKMPWKNPLKGGEKDVAMADVTVKGAGLFVGFHMSF